MGVRTEQFNATMRTATIIHFEALSFISRSFFLLILASIAPFEDTPVFYLYLFGCPHQRCYDLLSGRVILCKGFLSTLAFRETATRRLLPRIFQVSKSFSVTKLGASNAIEIRKGTDSFRQWFHFLAGNPSPSFNRWHSFSILQQLFWYSLDFGRAKIYTIVPLLLGDFYCKTR